MAEVINYVPYLPTEPPEGIVRFALEQGKLSKEYLIYRSGRRYLPLEDRTEDCVEVVCSGCGNTFQATKIRTAGCSRAYMPAPFGWWNELTGETVTSRSSTICPYCGGGMETLHIGGISNVIAERTWVAVIDRLPVPGKKDRLMIVDWMVSRDIDKNGSSRFWTHLHSAWIVEEKRIVRIAGNKRNYYVTSLTKPEQRVSYRDTFGRAKLIYPWDPQIMEGTTAENSKLDRYIEAGGERLVAYLGLYLKRPAVENLLMQGMGPLVKELLDNECDSHQYVQVGGYPRLNDWINWKEKRPTKMLGMNREELRIFRENGWGRKELSVIGWARAYGIELTWPEDVESIRDVGLYECEKIRELCPDENFWKVFRYLRKQKNRVSYLQDYWEMAERLQMDLDDEQIRWPKDLRQAHDNAVLRYNEQKDELTSAAFEKRVEELKHLSWEQDGLLIRPCASMKELRDEGKVLHHCVATYDQRYATGQTAIFFIRRMDKPEEPYYTLELDEKTLTVRQNRGLRNCGKTDEVQAFENAWIDWAKTTANKQKRKVSAA